MRSSYGVIWRVIVRSHIRSNCKMSLRDLGNGKRSYHALYTVALPAAFFVCLSSAPRLSLGDMGFVTKMMPLLLLTCVGPARAQSCGTHSPTPPCECGCHGSDWYSGFTSGSWALACTGQCGQGVCHHTFGGNGYCQCAPACPPSASPPHCIAHRTAQPTSALIN